MPKTGPKHPKHQKPASSKKEKVTSLAIWEDFVRPRVERAELELFCSPQGLPYVSLKMGDHWETYLLDHRRPGRFGTIVRHSMRLKKGETPKDSAVRDAVNALEGEAQFPIGKPPIVHPVGVRIAEHLGNIYLDLCDAKWRVVEITPAGWGIADHPPVYFTRPDGLLPLPVPKPSGDLWEIFDFVNVTRQPDRVLFLAWIFGALRKCDGYQYTHLFLYGVKGAAKTTAADIATSLLDPAKGRFEEENKSAEDLLVSAKDQHIVDFDNVAEKISVGFSNRLCRLSRGTGLRRRKRWSDNDLSVVEAHAPVIMTGLEQAATRDDLLDRMIALRLDGIPSSKRRDEIELLSEFMKRQPEILGALLTAASAALGNLPNVNREDLPRMAAFAKWVTAAENELGFADGEFAAAYAENRDELSATVLEFSAIGETIMAVVDNNGGSGTWTLYDLLAAINATANTQTSSHPDWPKTPRKLAHELWRIEESLKKRGYVVTRPGITSHLWIVLTDPQPQSNETVIVNVSTLRGNADRTMILQKGEHPFIQHESVINYADARIANAQRLDAQAKAGTIVPRQGCSKKLLVNIQGGVFASDRTPKKIVEFCKRVLKKT